MAIKKILFIDRDGTLICEPKDFQIDRLEKLQLMPHVIPSLLKLQKHGYLFVMVSNQDGMGTSRFPEKDFLIVQNAMMTIFESQGIHFESIRICPHLPENQCLCRKPHLGLVRDYLSTGILDFEQSYVIGDRETDIELAKNMGLKGLRIGNANEGYLSWEDIVSQIVGSDRIATVERVTKETSVSISLNLDSQSRSSISTGIGFFDHMLEQIAKHGGFSMRLKTLGDLHIDTHHTVEDTAIALGEAMRKALGDKFGIGRYGFLLPMDDAESTVSIDLSGRAFLKFNGFFGVTRVGELPTELVPHFFRSFSDALGATIHIDVKGSDGHHMVESIFKGVGRALRQAIRKTGDGELPSTKGCL